MTDQELEGELERMLTQWQPAGPPPALRARVVAAAAPRRLWPLAVAAAVLAAVAVSLPRATDALAASVPAGPPPLTRAAAFGVVTSGDVDEATAARLADGVVVEAAQRWGAAGAAPAAGVPMPEVPVLGNRAQGEERP